MPSPKKIAIITGTFPTVSETFIVNQIIALKKLGIQVDVFCFHQTSFSLENYSYGQIKNVSILRWRYYMPNTFFKRLRHIFHILFKSFKVGLSFKLISASVLKKGKFFNTHLFFKTYYNSIFSVENYDILHVHFGTNAVELLTQIQNFKKKVVVTFHGFDVHKYGTSFYESLIKQSHVSYTVNTNYTKSKVIDLGFNSNKIIVLPVGLDTNFFKPDKQPHPTFNILFVGRLVAFKAPLLAIEIVHHLIHQGFDNIRLNIVGDGMLHESCKNYIELHQLNTYITLTGNLSQQEIKNLMNQSDVFLFPGIVDASGRCENQGLAVQEAQAMELPVIISDVGGMKEGLINEITGFVVKEKDIAAFVNRIKFLMDNPLECQKMGKAGRKFVVERYDNSVLGEQLLDLYGN